MTSLRGFEAAARLKSFSLASAELSITQSAVSHQIKALEETLGVALFNRVGRSVELTVAGMDFLETVTAALDLLSRGKRRMSFYYRPGSVVLGATPGFANKWLLPRFPDLLSSITDIQPWLYTEDETYELKAQEVDLAIWYGDGNWEGVHSELLFHDRLTPLYAPHSMHRKHKLKSPADLKNHKLLYDERSDDWQSWLAHVDHPPLDDIKGCIFSDSALALDCAALGQGVVLGSVILAADMLERGELKQPFKQFLQTTDAYYLVSPLGQTMRPSVAATKSWIHTQVQQFCDRQGLNPERGST